MQRIDWGREFDANCEEISSNPIGIEDGASDADALMLADRMQRGELLLLKKLALVSGFAAFFVASLHLCFIRCRAPSFFLLTRRLQKYSHIGDAGARGLGEALKANSSLKELSLVSFGFMCPPP